MTKPVESCDPALQCCLPEENFFSADFPVCEIPEVSNAGDLFYAFSDPTLEIPSSPSATAYFSSDLNFAPFVKAPEADPAVNWYEMDPKDVQALAFEHHKAAYEDEIQRLDREFAEGVERLTYLTQPGVVYSVKEFAHLLPRPVLEQLAPFAHLNQDGIDGLAFTWAWKDGRPDIFVFRPNSSDGQQVGVVVNQEDGQVYILQNPTDDAAIQWKDGGSTAVDLRSFDFNHNRSGNALLDASEAYTVGTDNPLFNVPTEDTPPLILLGDKKEEPRTTQPGTLLEDGTLMGGGMFLLGSLQSGPNGNNPSGGVRPGLPFGRMLIQGGIGTGVFLGIHYGVLKMGVPEHIAPYVDVPFTIGAFSMVDSGSAFLAEKGLLSQRIFPGGINWRNVAHASPFLAVGSIGTGYALDAMGCEFGSTCNTVGTVFTTTTGYVGLSQTTRLLTQAQAPTAAFIAQHPHVVAFAEHFPRTTAFASRLGSAYGTTMGVGLTPATVNIGSKAVTLSLPGALGAGGIGGGVYVAGGGLAGGGGFLAGGLQAFGAIGVVALGSWIGGGIVDVWAWAGGYDKDGDYQLIDFTWDYMNQEVAGGFINAIFGPVIKGIQAAFISDTVYEGMEIQWRTWSNGCNTWADGVDQVLLSMALASTTGSGFENGSPNLHFNSDPFTKGVAQFYTNDAKAAGCDEDDDGEGCVSNADAIKAVYSMIDRLENSSQKHRLDDNARGLRHLMDRNGHFSIHEMKDYLTKLVRTAQKDGRLYPMVRKVLREARRQWAKRMVDVGLAHYEGDNVVPNPIAQGQLTEGQKIFLFGGVETYEAIKSGQIVDAPQIQSENVVLQNRIKALEHILELTDLFNGTSQPDVAALMFGSSS